MITWEDYPQLFIGNFKCEVKLRNGDVHIVDYTGVRTARVTPLEKEYKYGIYPYKILRIVGRSVDDLTKDELKELNKSVVNLFEGDLEKLRLHIKWAIENGLNITFRMALDLINMGVYPFIWNEKYVKEHVQ